MRTRAWRGTIAAAVGLLTIGALVGCGGSGGSSSGRSATVDFVIRWPESASRVIPAGTNRFVIFVNGEGMATQAFIIDQTTSSGTTTYRYRVNVPEGAKRLFSAAAKQLSSASGKGAKYATLTQVPLDSPDLRFWEGCEVCDAHPGAAGQPGPAGRVVAGRRHRPPAL